MENCILCKSKNIECVQKINSDLIIDLYRNELNVDVTIELKGNSFIYAFKCKDCKLLFFNPMTAGSEDFYENLQKLDSLYYSELRPEFIEALKHINAEDKVLEIGSGSAFFAQKVNKDNYVGLEYNQEAIDKAEKKGIKLLKNSIEDFSKNNSELFDVVCSFHVLEHVTNPYSFIEHSLKKLKKGGKFICAVPCSNSLLTSNINHVLNMPPHHITRWNIETFDFICSNFNLNKIHFYNDEVLNNRDYFEKEVETIFFNFFLSSNRIVIRINYLRNFKKILRRVSKFLQFHKFFKSKKKYGKNMMLIATKM